MSLVPPAVRLVLLEQPDRKVPQEPDPPALPVQPVRLEQPVPLEVLAGRRAQQGLPVSPARKEALGLLAPSVPLEQLARKVPPAPAAC